MNARRHFRLVERLNLPKLARLIKDLSNPLEIFDNDEFIARYRFDKDSFLVLYKLIVPSLITPTARGLPIPPLHCILITIRYFATGTFQLVHTDLFGVSQHTVSRIVKKVSQAIASNAN